jgi:hypothetical protein
VRLVVDSLTPAERSEVLRVVMMLIEADDGVFRDVMMALEDELLAASHTYEARLLRRALLSTPKVESTWLGEDPPNDGVLA